MFKELERQSLVTQTILEHCAGTTALSAQEREHLRTVAIPRVQMLRNAVHNHEAEELRSFGLVALSQMPSSPRDEQSSRMLTTLERLVQGEPCTRDDINLTLQYFSVFHHVVDGLIG